MIQYQPHWCKDKMKAWKVFTFMFAHRVQSTNGSNYYMSGGEEGTHQRHQNHRIKAGRGPGGHLKVSSPENHQESRLLGSTSR